MLVIPMRFELMTTGFGDRYSIQLSYGIIWNLSQFLVAHYINKFPSCNSKPLK